MPGPYPPIAETNAALTAPGQMFEMAELEIRGVPTRVWKNAPPSLVGVLEMSRAHGDKTFLVYEDEQVTFEEFFQQVAALARQLVERYGLEKGDRVAIAMRNFPEWAVSFWAAAAAGAVNVPLNAWWTGPELEYGLADSERLPVVGSAFSCHRLPQRVSPQHRVRGEAGHDAEVGSRPGPGADRA